MEKGINIAATEPEKRVLNFQAFIDAYKKTKPNVAGLTIDDNNYLRIIDEKGTELQVFEFTTHDGIQQFFDVAHEVMKLEE